MDKKSIARDLTEYITNSGVIEKFIEERNIEAEEKTVRGIIVSMYEKYDESYVNTEDIIDKARFYVDGEEIVNMHGEEEIKYILCLVFEERVKEFLIDSDEAGYMKVKKGFASGLKVEVVEDGISKRSANIGIPIDNITRDIIKYVKKGELENVSYRGKSGLKNTTYYAYKATVLLMAPTLIVVLLGYALHVSLLAISFVFGVEYLLPWLKEVSTDPIKKFPYFSASIGAFISIFNYTNMKYEWELKSIPFYNKRGIKDHHTSSEKQFASGVVILLVSVFYLLVSNLMY